jgi:hypothetical protein
MTTADRNAHPDAATIIPRRMSISCALVGTSAHGASSSRDDSSSGGALQAATVGSASRSNLGCGGAGR